MVRIRQCATILVLVGILGPVGRSAAVAQDTSLPRTVPAFAEAFVAAVQARDVEAWSRLVSDDIVMMAPSGRMLEGRQAFRELWTRSFEGRTGRNPLEVTVQDTKVSGDLAVVRAEYGPVGSEPVGQYVWTLERDANGGWSLAWWIFNRKTG